MMFADLVKTLPKLLSRETVVDRALKVADALKNQAIPAYESAVGMYHSQDLTSEFAKSLEKDWKSRNKVKGQGYMGEILTCLEAGAKLMEVIARRAEKIFQVQETSMGLDFAKTLVLNLVLAGDLVKDYSIDLLNALIYEECSVDGKEIAGKPTPAEYDTLKARYLDFVICCRALLTNDAELEKMLNSQQMRTQVSSLTETNMTAIHGLSTIDPIGLSGISVKWNPLYHVSMAIANWQLNRHKAKQEKILLINARLRYLEGVRTNKPSPRVEAEIVRLKKNVDKLEFDIREEEREWSQDGQ